MARESLTYEIVTTPEFKDWFGSLRDPRASTAIANGIARMSAGLFGNSKPIGDGLSELKIDVGAGYHVYFVVRDRVVVSC